MAKPSTVRTVLMFAPIFASCLLTSIGLFYSESQFGGRGSAIKQLLPLLGPFVHTAFFRFSSTTSGPGCCQAKSSNVLHLSRLHHPAE
jgi:hypothetical protein